MTTQYSIGSVNSRDGTAIGYRQLGHGPGVVLLHGTMSSGLNHTQLGEALADTFTVYLPDRRGRGLSGPYSADDTMRQEVDDLDALLTRTGARNVFAVSSGAIILLEAACSLPAIEKAAIFEPPLFPTDSVPKAVLSRFDSEIAQGKVAAALITGMKGAQLGPPIFRVMPRWLLELLTSKFIASQDAKPAGAYLPMRTLAPLSHYDFQLVAEMSGKFEAFGAVRAHALLLGGSRSPAYLKAALDALQQVLPQSGRIELPGLDHAASWNADIGGQPAAVAQELRRFFGPAALPERDQPARRL